MPCGWSGFIWQRYAHGVQTRSIARRYTAGTVDGTEGNLSRMRMIAVIIGMLIAAAGCGSDSPPAPPCSKQGARCNNPCCPGSTCDANLCVGQMASSCTGQPCSRIQPCCFGAICFVDANTGQGRCFGTSGCGLAGNTCDTMQSCCLGLTCPRSSDKRCQLGDVGDPCRQGMGCLMNLTCNGVWCTTSCSSKADCGSTNDCVSTAQGFSCFPSCSTNTDCGLYPGTACKPHTDPTGATVTVCDS
jgi:hypothetical protein